MKNQEILQAQNRALEALFHSIARPLAGLSLALVRKGLVNDAEIEEALKAAAAFQAERKSVRPEGDGSNSGTGGDEQPAVPVSQGTGGDNKDQQNVEGAAGGQQVGASQDGGEPSRTG